MNKLRSFIAMTVVSIGCVVCGNLCDEIKGCNVAIFLILIQMYRELLEINHNNYEAGEDDMIDDLYSSDSEAQAENEKGA